MRSAFFILLFSLSTLLLVGAERPSVIPLPSFYELGQGYFNLNENILIYSDAAYDSELHFLRNELLRYQQLPLAVSTEESGAGIVIKHRNPGDDLLYQLEVGETSISIFADSEEGAFYGIISLIQMVNNSERDEDGIKVPALLIKDKPVFEWRGLMLDESRHFFGLEKVKFLLDWMAYYKLNYFHWHLTDSPGWRIEIGKYPKLGLVGGIGNHSNPYTPAKYYTREEILEIVSYAAERKIKVIPEIDMPGHASAANRAYPEHSGGGSERYPDWTFHPAREATYQYLADILREVDVLFPSGMIHLGGDEVSFGNEQWKTDPEVQDLMKRNNLKDLKAVEDYFMHRMADTLIKMNNFVLAWDEMAGAQLPRDKSIIFWWRHDRPEQLMLGLDNGHKTVICPRLPLYFDFVQNDSHRFGRKWGGRFNELHDVYRFSLSDLPLEDRHKSLILGYQANVWTETIHNDERLDFMVFPRIAAMAESVWSADHQKDYDSFLTSLEDHLRLFRKHNIYFYNPFDEDEFPEPVYIVK